MLRPSLSEIIKKASEKKTKQEKIAFLQENDSQQLRQILQWTFDSRIQWTLPEGAPPYKPCPHLDQESMLYQECRRLYLFVQGGPPMAPLKRENLFIGILEAVHPDDAKLLLAMKEKKLPYSGLTPKIINEAFPELIYEQVS